MLNFGERLAELICEQNIDKKTFAKNVGINATCISHFILGKHTPTVKSLIKIADYFNCSTDFLLGREEENRNLSFKKCPPFSEQLIFLKEKFNFRPDDIYNGTEIAKSSYYHWLEGKQPTLDNIIRLANLFDCRVDFILGRES